MHYEVIWRINVNASSPEKAARMAQTIQRDPASLSQVFEVIDNDNEVVTIDLLEDD